MFRWCILCALLLFSVDSKSQLVNYVTNPSFETLDSTSVYGWQPKGWWSTDTSYGSFLPVGIGYPLKNAPYCPYGFQFPNNGRIMIITQFFCSTCSNQRGYPRNRLKSKLTKGQIYCSRYYVVNTNNATVGIDSFGIYFGDSLIDTISVNNIALTYITPQIERQGSIISDTLNWIPISGTMTANGNEKYLMLGNYKSNASTNTAVINPTYLPGLSNDLYIDNVSLVPIELSAYAGIDTSVVPGDSVYIGREQDVGIDYACQWFKLPFNTIAIDTIAGFWAKPAVTTTYVVRQQLWCSGVKWDTVVVHVNAVGIEEYSDQMFFNVHPNPAQNYVNLVWRPLAKRRSLLISDIAGRLVYKDQLDLSKGETQINTENLSAGTYIISIEGVPKRFRLVIEK